MSGNNLLLASIRCGPRHQMGHAFFAQLVWASPWTLQSSPRSWRKQKFTDRALAMLNWRENIADVQMLSDGFVLPMFFWPETKDPQITTCVSQDLFSDNGWWRRFHTWSCLRSYPTAQIALMLACKSGWSQAKSLGNCEKRTSQACRTGWNRICGCLKFPSSAWAAHWKRQVDCQPPRMSPKWARTLHGAATLNAHIWRGNSMCRSLVLIKFRIESFLYFNLPPYVVQVFFPATKSK